ncbi:hypothetical protein JIR001_28550 [Polycladomyces abyssicola]|uniref:Uncharacterized protein n=1 Tax=Polycladomyces abyssicola TaxID=1125966 RepID=A0A8D5ZPI1_9BACL|nr:hypothetical protein JIR001_28550 [Polycladomyces abyssicola]
MNRQIDTEEYHPILSAERLESSLSYPLSHSISGSITRHKRMGKSVSSVGKKVEMAPTDGFPQKEGIKSLEKSGPDVGQMP